MKRFFCFLMCAALALPLAACGGLFVDLDTSKSVELKEQYDFYGDSVNNIRTSMGITPEQADEVFIVLADCGLNQRITNIIDNKDSSYNVWYGSDYLVTTINNGVVEKVNQNLDELYPTKKLHNYLMDSELKEKSIRNDNGTVVGTYAYISVSNKVLSELTEYNLKKFISERVDGSNYSWISIVATDNTGIQFAGASTVYGSYGKMDDMYKVTEEYGTVELQQDGTYKLPEFVSN